MGTLITLDKDTLQTLENMRENDPDFNFSAYVRGCLTEDTTMLSQEQIDLKIRVLELDREKLDIQIQHLKDCIPFVKKVDEAKEAEREGKIANALEILTRLKGETRRDDMAVVHAKMTGLSATQLIKMADEKEEENKAKKLAKEDSQKAFRKEMDIKEAEDDATWEEKERLAEETAKAKELARIEKFGA